VDGADDGDVLLRRHLLHRRHHVRRRRRVEAARGLVEHDEGGRLGECEHQAQAALLAAREAALASHVGKFAVATRSVPVSAERASLPPSWTSGQTRLMGRMRPLLL